MTYEEFIQNILDTRGRFGIPRGVAKERHHIIPSCMGGTRDKENLIDLYPREHFIAHKLLFEENRSNSKLALAYWKMANTPRGYTVTPEEYEEARIACARTMSELHKGEGNPMYGKNPRDGKSPEELAAWNRKNSESQKRYFAEHPGVRSGANNSMYGKNAYEGKSPEEMAEIARKKSIGVSGGKNSHAKYVINLDTGQIFSTLGEANQWLISNGISVGSKDITNCCKHLRAEAGGYRWAYIDDYISNTVYDQLKSKIDFPTGWFKQKNKK